ncbi:replicative DNA helicase [Syntrophobacter fumaroxidans]|uniref:Replicative DNA helicase n=1 Tax=Syntrophobacter fumaroxidans (strain DSM 10017 / MPOB) TaxID=335543 RepID=A0LN55_SYNFM|nr:replicative DNA helicase [Syntrophobacter fumaroxidans]ABK18857.1 primary replicative DNA helicase [Syntrophobacter fumaroxidans MPOB]HOI93950.1 replicative DNA helicase [Syntrophobacter fumaroxidans]
MDAIAEELKKVPPQQLEAEQSLLGGILIDNDGLPAALEIIKGDEFYRESHRIIFRAIQELFERNEPIDLVTTAALLAEKNQLEAVGGAPYLASLVDAVPSASNVATYARIINEKALLRRLIQTANEISSWSYGGGKNVEEILDEAESSIFSITENRIRNSYSSLKDIVKKSIESIERYQEQRDMVNGVPSHYRDLDKITAGFQKSDLIVIAARPSMGKTALALCIARNAAVESGIPVGFFSLEMSKEQLAMRLLCAEARVDSHKIRTGFLSQTECAKMLTAAGSFMDVPIYIDDTPSISALELRAKARRMMADRGLGMVVVDYLQLMRGKESERREQEISDISRSLKALAKELNIPVIALAQLNRKVEERSVKKPMLSDLRESGAIEQDADVIAFIYRDEVYNPNSPDKGTAEILIAKQRNGPTGEIRLGYISLYTRFENLALSS